MAKSNALEKAVDAGDLSENKAADIHRSFKDYKGSDLLPVDEILSVLPKHRQYVEVLPGMPLFPAKSPAPVEVVNDYAKNVTSFFRVLRTPKLLRRFCQIHRVLADLQFDEWGLVGKYLTHESSKFWRACVYYHLVRQLFTRGQKLQDSLWDSYERDFKVFRNTWSKSLYEWMGKVDPLLPNIHGRLMRVQYEYNTWQRIFELYDDPNTLFWIDGRGDLIASCAREDDAILPRVLKKVEGKFAVLYWSRKLPKSLRRWDVHNLANSSCLIVKE